MELVMLKPNSPTTWAVCQCHCMITLTFTLNIAKRYILLLIDPALLIVRVVLVEIPVNSIVINNYCE